MRGSVRLIITDAHNRGRVVLDLKFDLYQVYQLGLLFFFFWGGGLFSLVYTIITRMNDTNPRT